MEFGLKPILPNAGQRINAATAIVVAATRGRIMFFAKPSTFLVAQKLRTPVTVRCVIKDASKTPIIS